MNHEAKVARVALGVLIGFICLAFVPGWMGVDMMKSGNGIVALCLFGAIASGVTCLIFRRRARLLDGLLEGPDVLAKWQIPSDVWVKHVSEDLKEEKQAKKGLFLITAFWVVIVGGGFVLFTGKDGLFVVAVLLAVLLILVPFAFWLPKVRAARMLKNPTPVIIGRGAAYVGGELHDWRLVGSFLSGAEIDYAVDPKELRIDYYYISGSGGPVPCEIRIPIPPGKETEAANVTAELMKIRKHKHDH